MKAIKELARLREDGKVIAQKIAKLSNPVLTDVLYIPTIYSRVNDLLKQIHATNTNRGEADKRRKLIYVILSLYCPDALAGGRITKGVRQEIENQLSDVKGCTISNYCKELSFFYNNYKDFQEEVDYLYAETYKFIEYSGMLKQKEKESQQP